MPLKFGAEKLGLPLRFPPKAFPKTPETLETTFSAAILAQVLALSSCWLNHNLAWSVCRRQSHQENLHRYGGPLCDWWKRPLCPVEGVSPKLAREPPRATRSCWFPNPQQLQPLRKRRPCPSLLKRLCGHPLSRRRAQHLHRQQCRSRRQSEGVSLKIFRQLLPPLLLHRPRRQQELEGVSLKVPRPPCPSNLSSRGGTSATRR